MAQIMDRAEYKVKPNKKQHLASYAITQNLR